MPRTRWNAAAAKLLQLGMEQSLIRDRHRRGLIMRGDEQRLQELQEAEETALAELEAADDELWELQHPPPKKA